MPTLKDLNETSEWVAHEFRVTARQAGWLTKTTGVEALFHKRLGALRRIGADDCPENLALRALPDMIAVSKKPMTAIVEAKAMDSTTPNAAVELTQLLLLAMWSRFGVTVYYCFGYPDLNDDLEAFLVPVHQLRPTVLWMTPRAMKLKLEIEKASRWLFPDAQVHGGETEGSNDPFALIPKKQVIEMGHPVKDWLRQNSGGAFGMKERIGWEGQEQAHQPWMHFKRKYWRLNG